MIKDFKNFSKSVQSDIDRLNQYKDKARILQKNMDIQYKNDIISSIKQILNTIKDKYDYDELSDFLLSGIIKDGEDTLQKLRELDVHTQSAPSSLYNIVWDSISNDWYFDVVYNDNIRELSELETESLFKIFQLLLNGMSAILNLEVLKKLNESTIFSGIEDVINKRVLSRENFLIRESFIQDVEEYQQKIKEIEGKISEMKKKKEELDKKHEGAKYKIIGHIVDICDYIEENLAEPGEDLHSYLDFNEDKIEDILSALDLPNGAYMVLDHGDVMFDIEGDVYNISEYNFDQIFDVLKILISIPKVSAYYNKEVLKKLNK